MSNPQAILLRIERDKIARIEAPLHKKIAELDSVISLLLDGLSDLMSCDNCKIMARNLCSGGADSCKETVREYYRLMVKGEK